MTDPIGPQSSTARVLGAAACRFVGHRFVKFADGYKRCCTRCDREEWVMGNPYPRIGQPQHEWKHMPFRHMRF